MAKRGNPNWKPGISGNPNGRPPSEDSLNNLLREELEKVDPDKKLSNKEIIAAALVRMAKEGNRQAIETIFNRLDGTPKQSLEVTGNIQFPEVVGFYPEDYDRSTSEDSNADKESEEV